MNNGGYVSETLKNACQQAIENFQKYRTVCGMDLGEEGITTLILCNLQVEPRTINVPNRIQEATKGFDFSIKYGSVEYCFQCKILDGEITTCYRGNIHYALNYEVGSQLQVSILQKYVQDNANSREGFYLWYCRDENGGLTFKISPIVDTIFIEYVEHIKFLKTNKLSGNRKQNEKDDIEKIRTEKKDTMRGTNDLVKDFFNL